MSGPPEPRAPRLLQHVHGRRKATAEVFESWLSAAAARFAAAGIPRAESRELAISLLASLEGAFILSRSLRSTRPIEIAGATVTAAVRAALPKRRRPRARRRQ